MSSGSTKAWVADQSPLVLCCLKTADDAFVLGHRLSEWCGHGPSLESDIAITDMGLELLGQARSLYRFVARIDGSGIAGSADVQQRDAAQFRNLLLLEQPNQGYAHLIVRLFLYASFATPLWSVIKRADDEDLATIARQAEGQMKRHLAHAAESVVRQGNRSDECRAAAQDSVDELWPYTGEMFDVDDAVGAMFADSAPNSHAQLHAAFREPIPILRGVA